jgi:hypothetical protein
MMKTRMVYHFNSLLCNSVQALILTTIMIIRYADLQRGESMNTCVPQSVKKLRQISCDDEDNDEGK